MGKNGGCRKKYNTGWNFSLRYRLQWEIKLQCYRKGDILEEL